MVAISSLSFSVYEQYTSNTAADGTTSQSAALQAGVSVGTDDGSKYGSAIVLDVAQAPASQKLKDGLKAVNTLTQVATYARTQAPKDAAASRLAEAIGELRAINLTGGGIGAVQEVVRIAQEIASAVRDLAAAEKAIAADGGSASDASAGAAAAAAISAALTGSSSALTQGDNGTAAATTSNTAAPADTTADPSTTTVPAVIEAGYSKQVGSTVTGLVAGAAGIGSGSAADDKASSSLADAIIAQLQATGLPVDGSNLAKSLQDLITNPLLGADELQASAQQAGLNVTVATSLDVTGTLEDPRNGAAAGVSSSAVVAAVDDPYDELIKDAVGALAIVAKGLRRSLPPLLNSPDRKVAREARKAQDQFAQAIADTAKAIGDYYNAKAEIEADGGTDGAPSAATKAQIDAADAVVNGPNAGNDQGGTVGEDAGVSGEDIALGDSSDVEAAIGDDGTPAIAAGATAGITIGLQVSVNIQV